jgi:hypothetical protein
MCDPEERAELLKEYEAIVAKLRLPEAQARMIADGLDRDSTQYDNPNRLHNHCSAFSRRCCNP